MLSWMKVSAAGVLAVGWMPTLPPFFLPLTGVFFALLAARRYPRAAPRVACALLGMAYACWWGRELLDSRLPAELESLPLDAVITVLEPPASRPFSAGGRRQRFAAEVALTGCPDALPDCEQALGRVLLSYYGDQSFRAGERWRVSLKLKRPRGLANPGSFNYESWLARHRFAATGHIRDRDVTPLAPAQGLFHQRWRQHLGDRLRVGERTADVTGVLLALTTGDRSGLSQSTWQRFQRYGLNHLVVISGLHVGLVAGIGFLLGRLGGRRCAHLSAAALALVYSALAGFALPTVRALVMLAGVQLVAISGRRLRPMRSLAAALLAVSLLDPLASFGAGFWLSFAAVACIFYLHHMFPALPAWRFTLLLQLVLAPAMGLLASFWFGGFGWLAPLANLVAVPVLSFWVAPLCLLGALLAPTGLAEFAWDLAALPIQGFLALDAMTALPLWLPFRPGLIQLVLLLTALLLLVSRRLLPMRGAVVGFLVLAALSGPSPPAREGLEFWLLDVGQGLAIVVFDGSFVMVYDTGAGDPAGPNMASAVLVPFLQRQGVREIDLLVLSHADNDHASGVYTVHEAFPVAETWFGEAAFPGIRRQRPCPRGQQRYFGSLRIEVLATAAAEPGNNASCVLRLASDGYRVLLPGDIESSVEHALVREQAELLAANALVLPHHGSRSSSSSPFIAGVAPELVLLSRGYRNRFGHPHGMVLRRLQVFGLRACDTTEQGALRLRAREGRFESIMGWRHKRHYYWAGVASPPCVPAYNGAQVE